MTDIHLYSVSECRMPQAGQGSEVHCSVLLSAGLPSSLLWLRSIMGHQISQNTTSFTSAMCLYLSGCLGGCLPLNMSDLSLLLVNNSSAGLLSHCPFPARVADCIWPRGFMEWGARLEPRLTAFCHLDLAPASWMWAPEQSWESNSTFQREAVICQTILSKWYSQD